MTQAELADRIGVHRSTIANYELGRRKPSFMELKRIAEILHLDVNYIVEAEEVNEEAELLTRAQYVFGDINISNEDKDAIFRDIMEIYMKGKSKDESNTTRTTRKP